jgi:hypothetical protein
VVARGDGPAELRRLDRIYPLGGDSTLIVDQSRRRWLVLAGARVVATLTGAGRQVERLPYVEGIDAEGNVVEVRPFSFYRSPGVPFVRERSNAESLQVVFRPNALSRSNAVAGVATTLARLAGAEKGQALVWRDKPPPASLWLLENPLATEDEVLLFPDGWLATAYANPYRVDWRAPDGRSIRGRELSVEKVPVDESMRRTLTRARWPQVEPEFRPADVPAWPKVLPAFVRGALVALPDGRLAIHRAMDPARQRETYDIIGRTGEVELQLLVPSRVQIIAWSRQNTYGIFTDEDLQQWLVKHPWTA